mmetsp:Transcript_25541/g.70535  ORF Transcript_25541/g.70535 Transcript_25541/m.70535 type:complete len:345 (+) Transcript_25541:51-1085(+)
MMKPTAGLSTSVVAALLAIAVFAAAVCLSSFRSKNILPQNDEGFEYYKTLALTGIEDLSPFGFDSQGWKEDLAGFWMGELEFGDDGLRILFRFTETYGKMHCYSLDQGGSLIPASAAQYGAETGELLLVFEYVQGVYQGKLKEGVLKGKWSQMGRSLSLELQRDNSSLDVPREFRFLVDKAVTGSAPRLQKMVGYWSGLLEDQQEVELVVLHVAKINETLVEPMIFLPDEDTDLPLGIRTFILKDDTSLDKPNVKIVLDDRVFGNNAIFDGSWEDGDFFIIGMVSYDDTDAKQPLVLKWSEKYPAPHKPWLKTVGMKVTKALKAKESRSKASLYQQVVAEAYTN